MSAREHISEQLSAYLDGELSADEAQALERAVASDEALAAELRRLQAVRRLVRQLPREKAGDDFVSRVLERAERTHLVSEPLAVPEQGVVRWARHLATAAMVLLAAGIVGVVALTVSKTPNMGKFEPQASQAPRDNLPKDAGRKSTENYDGGEVAMTAGGDVSDMGARAGGTDPYPSTLEGGSRRPAVLAFNFVIQTPNLQRTQHSLEDVLDRSRPPLMSMSGRGRQYDVRPDGDQSVQYRLRMTMAQAQQLQKDVEQLRLSDLGRNTPSTADEPEKGIANPGSLFAALKPRPVHTALADDKSKTSVAGGSAVEENDSRIASTTEASQTKEAVDGIVAAALPAGRGVTAPGKSLPSSLLMKDDLAAAPASMPATSAAAAIAAGKKPEPVEQSAPGEPTVAEKAEKDHERLPAGETPPTQSEPPVTGTATSTPPTQSLPPLAGTGAAEKDPLAESRKPLFKPSGATQAASQPQGDITQRAACRPRASTLAASLAVDEVEVVITLQKVTLVDSDTSASEPSSAPAAAGE